jgi:methionyl-tRNA synthetase
MESVRRGLRQGAIEKDTYERLTCADCEEELATQAMDGEVGKRRVCPECGTEWREMP